MLSLMKTIKYKQRKPLYFTLEILLDSMTNILYVAGKLSKALSPHEILAYCLVLENHDRLINEINLGVFYEIFGKTKGINILRDLAKKKVISGTIEDNVLTLIYIFTPDEIIKNSILSSVVTSERKNRGSRIANSEDVRKLIMHLVPEEEESLARRNIRKIIEICNEIHITDSELTSYITREITKGQNWKNIISSYGVRKEFEKNFSDTDLD